MQTNEKPLFSSTTGCGTCYHLCGANPSSNGQRSVVPRFTIHLSALTTSIHAMTSSSVRQRAFL